MHTATHTLVSLRDWSPQSPHASRHSSKRANLDANHRSPAFAQRAVRRRFPLCPPAAMDEQTAVTTKQDDEFYQSPRPVSKRVRQLRKKIDRSVAALRDASAAMNAPPEMQAELERMRQELMGLLEARQEAMVDEDSSSSSSSSSSSEDDEAMMIKDQSTSTLDQIMQPVTTGTAGRVLVCTGKDCTKRGATDVLAAFEAAASPDVKVIACKCLGKCKQAPAARVKVQGASGSALHTRIRPEEAALLVGTYFVPVPHDDQEMVVQEDAADMEAAGVETVFKFAHKQCVVSLQSPNSYSKRRLSRKHNLIMADPLPDEGPGYGSANEDENTEPAISRMGGSDEEGEDLMENMDGDYRANPLLDRYEEDGLDNDYAGEDDAAAALAARRAAERELDRRDVREGKRGRRALPGALEEDSDEDQDDEARRRRRRKRRKADDAQADEPDAPLQVDLDGYEGPVPEFLAQEPVQREVARRFRIFLRTFTDDKGEEVYQSKLRNLGSDNKQSLVVDFEDLAKSMGTLASWLADVPRVMLDIFNKVALDVAVETWPEYQQLAGQVFVRIANLPIVDQIRDLRQSHINLLIRTTGVVTRRTAVYPQLQTVNFDCVKCGYLLGPFTQSGDSEVKPKTCPQCTSEGPFSMNVQQTIYRNYQRLTVQESPGSVPAGRLPRQKDVILVDDLIDTARPGDTVDIVGIYTSSFDYSLNVKSGFPVFNTVIEANHVEKRSDAYAVSTLTDEDAEACRKLGQDPRIATRVIKSLAPSIYGLDNVKLSIALALFGGCEKHPSPTTRLRGDINVLLLGDPGTAKSQMLKYVERIAQRAVFTTGKGASAVGLTAAVQRDPLTREWTLEGGALVLADRGVCMIDEFDKMNDQDRVSIHEAMEQQTISISKAGIVTTLQARCCVLAAANPIGGRYDPSRTFAENVELSDPILSRFDYLAVVRDIVDPVNDERLATFVVDSHVKSNAPVDEEEGVGVGGNGGAAHDDPDVIPQELLKKYITYAKVKCTPKMHNTDYDKIAQVYAELRREAAVTHSMPIAVRHLESIIRMSEAHARMHLREYINSDDIDTAIRLLLESFVSSQKFSVQKALSRRFRRFLALKQDFNTLTLTTLQSLVRDALRLEQLAARAPNPEHVEVEATLLGEKMREYNITDLVPFYKSKLFADAGFSLSDDGRIILLSR